MQKKEIQDITKDTISIDLDKIIEKDKTTVEENKSKEIKKIENIVTYKEVPIDYKEIVVPIPTPKKEEKKTEEVILPKIEEKNKEEEKSPKGDRINADQENAEIEVVKKKNKTVKKKVVKKKKDTNEKTKDSVDVIQCEKHSVK